LWSSFVAWLPMLRWRCRRVLEVVLDPGVNGLMQRRGLVLLGVHTARDLLQLGA
jgi:hypothetical protein